MSRSSEPSERVLLVMEPGRDRELITEWIGGSDGYEVVAAPDPSSIPDSYDICLLEAAIADRCGETLRDRRDAAGAYLPHVLLRSEATSDGVGESSTLQADSERFIDEVLDLPVKRDDLVRRIENLLGTRRASAELAERQHQYRELVELTPEAILLVADGRIRHANSAAVELFGVATEGLVGSSVDRFVPAESATTLAEIVERVPDAGDGATEFTELGLTDARGREIESTVAGVTVTYGGDQVVQLLIRDLTESRRQAERLRLFGRAIEAAAHGIVICDARAGDMPMVYANAGFCRITGYSMGEVLGRNCRFLQGENTDPAAVEKLRAAVEAGEATSVDLLNYRKDGTPFWNRVEITPIRNKAGELTHFLGSQRDITERIRTEQRLTVLDRILRHNVRNKTNVIRGYADAIIDGDRHPDGAASRIREAADELYTISEQVREFDSVVRGEEDGTQLVELDAIVGEAVTALRQEYPEADVQFRASGRTAIEAPRTLRAALHDLLYQLGDAEQAVAEITLVREGAEIRLEIIDRGGAIPREDLDLVAARTETPLEHLQGLELWLLRWAVEQADGEFTVSGDDGDPRIQMQFPVAPQLRDS